MNEKDNALKKHCIELLNERGVTLEDMALIVYDLQYKYCSDLTIEKCVHNLGRVLEKREVQNAVITAVTIDKLSEEGHISGPLQDMLKGDDGLYGIDEMIPLSITNIYGTIGLTNFGYLDKAKPGIIGRLNDDHENGKINVFLDDIVCALCAATCSRIAHNKKQ